MVFPGMRRRRDDESPRCEECGEEGALQGIAARAVREHHHRPGAVTDGQRGVEDGSDRAVDGCRSSGGRIPDRGLEGPLLHRIDCRLLREGDHPHARGERTERRADRGTCPRSTRRRRHRTARRRTTSRRPGRDRDSGSRIGAGNPPARPTAPRRRWPSTSRSSPAAGPACPSGRSRRGACRCPSPCAGPDGCTLDTRSGSDRARPCSSRRDTRSRRPCGERRVPAGRRAGRRPRDRSSPPMTGARATGRGGRRRAE